MSADIEAIVARDAKLGDYEFPDAAQTDRRALLVLLQETRDALAETTRYLDGGARRRGDAALAALSALPSPTDKTGAP